MTHLSKLAQNKIFRGGLVLLAMVLFFWIIADVAFAVTTVPTPTPKGAGLNKAVLAGVNVAGYAVAIMVGLAILQSILGWVITFAGFLLNQFFTYNILLNPSIMPVVTSGWTIMRDIANGLLIFVLLWIAFSIIFNLEKVNGKQLFARVVVVALLINFSLTMVSSVFAFANLLAKPFVDAIGTPDVAGLITGKTQLHTATSQLNDADIDALEQIGNAQNQPAPTGPQDPGGLQPEVNSNPDKSFTSNILPQKTSETSGLAGVNHAEAVGEQLELFGVAAACGLAGLATAGVAAAGCAGAAVIGAIAKTIASWGLATAVIAITWKQIINLAIADFFLLLTAFAMTAAGIVLFARIIAMVFVAVLAPAAFIMYAFPFGGKKLWDMWLNNLFKWAFFAPAFYFLFYLSFLVLEQMSKNIPATGQFQANFPAVFTLIVFLGFLFASIGIAHKMGITVADSFIKWGQKQGWNALGGAWNFGKSAVTGFAMPRLGGLSERLDKKIGASENPILRRTMAIPSIGLRKVTALGRARVKEAEKGLGEMTAKEIKRALGQGALLTLAERTAAVQKLQSYQDLSTDKTIPGYDPGHVLAAVDALQGMGGEFMSLLKAMPHLTEARHVSDKDRGEMKKEYKVKYGREISEQITKEYTDEYHRAPSENEVTKLTEDRAAQRYVMTKMNTGDITKMDFSTFQGDEHRQMRLMFLDTKEPEYWGALTRAKPEVGQSVAKELKTPEGKEIYSKMSVAKDNWLNSSPARAMGWSAPVDAEKPIVALTANLENLDARLKELAESINSLANMKDSDAKNNKMKRVLGDFAFKLAERDAAVKKIKERPNPPPVPDLAKGVLDARTQYDLFT